jgi:hypothetical protein
MAYIVNLTFSIGVVCSRHRANCSVTAATNGGASTKNADQVHRKNKGAG